VTVSTAATAAPSLASAAASTASSVSSSAPPAARAPASLKQADPTRLRLEGLPIQGGVMRARVDPGTRGLKFPGHRVVISPEGSFYIAFFRNAPPREVMEITFPDGAVLEHPFAVTQRTFGEEEINGLPERFVKMDKTTKGRHAAIHARLNQVRMRYDEVDRCRDQWGWPLEGIITSRYGSKRRLNGTDGGIHWGVDIAANVGTPVKAPCGGKVVAVEKNVPLAGNTMVIDHGQGLSSTFLHLQSFRKKVGDEVKSGDLVAAVGNTGRSTGPHLDWRMNLFEIRVDPECFLPDKGGCQPDQKKDPPAVPSAGATASARGTGAPASEASTR
ncbi:MAG: M23 family metallopeptidase, partial [Myxococcota bacterium]